MRYGVLADIHGNLDALEAALELLRREGVDRFVCPGDLVGYGPFPNECVEVVAGLGATCVAGNHDLIALGQLSDDRCDRWARSTLRWTREVMTDTTREYLLALPLRARLDGASVMAHGSLDDAQEYVLWPDEADAQLRQLEREHPDARVLLLGHTHWPWAYSQRHGSCRITWERPMALDRRSAYLLNPGSVGQSEERRPRARCVLLDLEREQATYYAVPYDHDRCREALGRHGLPLDSCHLPRTLVGRCIDAYYDVVGSLLRRPRARRKN